MSAAELEALQREIDDLRRRLLDIAEHAVEVLAAGGAR